MKTKIILLFLCIYISVKAQDPTFSQFNSVPLYFNPAFAGSAEKSRLALSYRNQWTGLYQTYHLSYDQAIKPLHGGVGLLVYNDHSGNNRSNSLNVFYSGLAYAAKFNIFNKLAISPAVKIGYRATTIQAIENDNWGLPGENYKRTKNNIDVSAGLAINTEKFYMGFAADHINKPDVGVLGPSVLPIKYSAQLGCTFQKHEESIFSISPSILYQQQQNFSLLQSNLSFKYKWAILGIGYASNSYSGMIGYYSKKIIIGYSYEYFYDLSVNKTNQPSANEISLRYFFSLKKNKEETIK